MHRIAGFLLLVAFAAHAEPATEVFPELYARAGQAPPEILVRRELTAADEQPKDARNVISNATVQNPQRLPLGPNSRVIGTFTPQPDKGPVKLVLDWAGYETAKPAAGADSKVVVNVFFACEGTNDFCGDTSPSRRIESQKIFFVSPMLDEKTSAREVVIDGKPKAVFIGHDVLANDIPAGRPVAVHLSFNAPPHIETHRLRATLLYGDFSTQRPVEPAKPKPWTRIATIAAMLLLAATWWRRGRSDDAFESEEPPKVLGSLLRILGLLWAIAGVAFFDYYSMALGVLLAFAGGCLYYGRSLAVPAMWLLLLVAWTWSIREVGTDVKQLFPRVGLITILWAWVVFGGTASRLGTSGREG
ncbi:MAG: hypothetical protein ACXWHZ_18485 [Usitatibacter sp.]